MINRIKLFKKNTKRKYQKELSKIFTLSDLKLLQDNFDEEFYLAKNIDVKVSGVLPLFHYVVHGEKENRSPIKGFIPSDNKQKLDTNDNENIFISFLKYNDISNLKHNFDVKTEVNIDVDKSASFSENVDIESQRNDIDVVIHESFDEEYYLDSNPDIKDAGISAIEHYMNYGWKEGRSPTDWFDVTYYLETYKDVKNENIEPFEHYISTGKLENRKPKSESNIDSTVFEDVDENTADNIIKELFDEEYYLRTYPDIKSAGVDPFEHYINYGWKEYRCPNDWFDVRYYLETYKDIKEANVEPFEHYITTGKYENRKATNFTEVGNSESTHYLREPKLNTDYVTYRAHDKIESKLKFIAFYLPQFHAFPENDEWWGKGFTEWTNVSKALPNFIGHHQPHLPIHYGFYDLNNPEVMIEQAKLAKNYGIQGFNFYYYWFDGKILMEKPFEILLENKEIDIDFCITWANENWSRRWDGAEHDILIAQNHSEQDSINFIENLYKYFNDERYIRIDNKPVLIIYRSDIIPDMKETVALWREKVKEAGFDGIYLICSQTFGITSPEEYGFDAAMEFPPHTAISTVINHKVDIINKNFEGRIYDYKEVVDNACNVVEPDYKKFRTAMLSWDNTARKQNNSHIFNNFSISQYKKWISHLSSTVLDDDKYADDEKIVFVNAWNEWAEGTHLEPDRKFGYNYLQSTYDVLKAKSQTNKIVFVCHDAFFSGAQLLSLNIIKVLHEKFKLDVHFLLKKGGKLEKEFEKYATVYNLENDYNSLDDQVKLIKYLHGIGAEQAICNSVVSGDILSLLNKQGFYTISLIHELPKLIKQHGLESNANLIAEHADRVIFPSNYVKDKFLTLAKIKTSKVLVSPQGLYQTNKYQDEALKAKHELREKLNIDVNAKIILGSGYGDHRKGVDIFVDVALRVTKERADTYFIWTGDLHPEMAEYINSNFDLNNSNIIFIPAQPDISLYYTGADIYLMTSREDPFPSVVMEAMNAEVPVVGFEDAGGFIDIVTPETGLLVPFEDANLMTKSVLRLLGDEEQRQKLGKASAKLIKENFIWKDYIYKLLEYVGTPYKKVSVIVPNYNYEEHIEARLKSVEDQSYPVYELIYLEDCSKDNSLEIAKDFQISTCLDMTISENIVNSGSVFKQWGKGINQSNADYIWIAEADDLCSTEFLSEVMKGFDNPDVVLSYSQSMQIDENDEVINETYLDYTNDIHTTKWLTNYTRDGCKELADTLVIKNTIPNVSAVVFKQLDISSILDKLLTFKVGGDWYFYSYLLEKGSISYNAKSLNYHRRHADSVTVNAENNIKHFEEIVQMQDKIISMVKLTKVKKQQVLDYRTTVKQYLGIS
jgi:glycosyltransferase involved in cell wall biosynthesis